MIVWTLAITCFRGCFAAAEFSRGRWCKVAVSQVSQTTAGFVRVADSSIGQSKSSLERTRSTMSVSISNSRLSQAAAPTQSLTKAQPSEASEHPAQAPGDSVKLSQAAQVHLFKQQGQSLSQIAANLGISAATVDGYLGIAVPKAPAAPAAATPSAPSPEPAGEHAGAPAQPTPVAAK
jgi:DNA-binding CsgD family transcriptional regulator